MLGKWHNDSYKHNLSSFYYGKIVPLPNNTCITIVLENAITSNESSLNQYNLIFNTKQEAIEYIETILEQIWQVEGIK